MIRKRLANFQVLLQGLLGKGFKPKPWYFLCLVSREMRAPYPVNSVSRIPWNRCLVSRVRASYPVNSGSRIPCFCAPYPVKNAGVYWLIRWRCCDGVGGLLMMTLSPWKSNPIINSIFLSSFKAAANFLLKHLISLLLLPLNERMVSILIGYGLACVAR